MAKFTTDTRYLSHTDISDVNDTVVTIKEYQQETLGMGASAQEKYVLYFKELKKGLALNKTNGKIIVKMYGEEMDNWIGKQISLYVKDDVEFQGEIVSAIRVRVQPPKGMVVSSVTEPSAGDVLMAEVMDKLALAQSNHERMGLLRVVAETTALTDEQKLFLRKLISEALADMKTPSLL